jgi:hypothetical protein
VSKTCSAAQDCASEPSSLHSTGIRDGGRITTKGNICDVEGQRNIINHITQASSSNLDVTRVITVDAGSVVACIIGRKARSRTGWGRTDGDDIGAGVETKETTSASNVVTDTQHDAELPRA